MLIPDLIYTFYTTGGTEGSEGSHYAHPFRECSARRWWRAGRISVKRPRPALPFAWVAVGAAT